MLRSYSGTSIQNIQNTMAGEQRDSIVTSRPDPSFLEVHTKENSISLHLRADMV